MRLFIVGESYFNTKKIQSTFYLRDNRYEIAKVILNGGRPNNFDLAASVVVKGKYSGDYFHATEILTKCPSKYEGQTGVMKKQS